MALYYEIRFTITDEAAYAATEDGVQFEFLDANGERLPDGATMSGQTAAQADGSLVQSGSLSAQSDPFADRGAARLQLLDEGAL